MADNSSRIGSALGGSTQPVRPLGGNGGGGGQQLAARVGSRQQRATEGIQVFRMLPADTPVESLDHTARRGTYIDILV
jgi:hypothetical protein